LQGHYGPAATLTLMADDGGGTVAELLLPLADAGAAEEMHAQGVASRTGRR
jgi:hypothetical protein